MSEPQGTDPAPATIAGDRAAPIPGGSAAPPPPAPTSAPSAVAPPGAFAQPVVAPREPRDPTPLAPRWLLAGAAAAIAADLGLRQAPWNNLGGALLIGVLAMGLVGSGYLRTRASRLMAGSAIFFGVFLAVRTEPLLTAFNILAACSLLVLAAVHGKGRSFWELRPLRLAADASVVLIETVSGFIEVPAELGARFRVIREQAQAGTNQTAYAVLRGLAMAAPVVVVLGLLLASADAVFQSFFVGFAAVDLAALIGHLFLLLTGAYTMMVLLRLAHLQGAVEPLQRAPSLGHIETGMLLGAVNLLFGAFAVAQVLTIAGGAEDALGRAGLDPKQFARQGFFQLLWVAGLTLVLLMTVHVVTSENVKAQRVARFLSPVTVLLTVLIVFVAFTRIRFYIDDSGQTPLRFYSSVFSVWIAVAFVITAVRIAGVKPNRTWLLPVLMVSGLVTLGALDVANPEAVIAHDNLNRNQESLYWHVVADQFSGDGDAVLAEGIERLSPELRDRITPELCRAHDRRTRHEGWLSANLGQRRAEAALDDLCP